ncbi:MAG: hypothetical protein U9Q34_05870 [Elusimicrobiota bacterium]|nr:hypothetical protein [Elusimicrobiota bacterium]
MPNTLFAADDLEKWSFALNRGSFSEKKQNGMSIETGPIVGFELARRFSDKVDIGFEFSGGKSKKEFSLSPGIITTYNNYFSTVFLNYSLGKVIKGLYVGPQVGIIIRSHVKSNDNINMTAAARGIKIGWRRRLKGKFSFGVQAQYIEVDKAGKSVQEGAPQVNVIYSVPQTYFTKYLFSLRYKF